MTKKKEDKVVKIKFKGVFTLSEHIKILRLLNNVVLKTRMINSNDDSLFRNLHIKVHSEVI